MTAVRVPHLRATATVKRTVGRVASAWPRPRVLDVQGDVAVEVDGGHDDLAFARVAVVAHWAPTAALSRSFGALVSELRAAAYDVIVVSTAEPAGPLLWRDGPWPDRVTVLRRPNIGYDFGSWATALDRYPQIAAADRALFINDSLVGPFRSMQPLLESFHSSRADVWGITETMQYGRHLQSYALGFRGGTLSDPAIQRFWRGVRVEHSKQAVIWRAEIGLSRLLGQRGMSIDAAFSPEDVGCGDRNPTIVCWRRLLDLGMPFVKRELLKDPSVAVDAPDVPAELLARFGVVAADWW